MSNFHILLKVSNVIVYLWFLSATVYSTVGPNPDGDVIKSHLTYITPAHWINLAWTAVHFLLGGFVIYQWFEPAHDGTVHGVGWHFVISTLLNTLWFRLWNTGHLYLSFIAILFTASSVSFVFYVPLYFANSASPFTPSRQPREAPPRHQLVRPHLHSRSLLNLARLCHRHCH
ncbi:hypothetical protein BC936DRAFT_147214 [Jimgerdemannia flammicorona]|uniref:Uncharacterized protein n=1 Tax=Jimgerdemannia flammicorona TaxID=994334 RepID=A0A433DL23_9FUNG|nr:hypothetical protein BC936DRAFT_147214 [Jimgerdemannia flammicorona]